MTPFEELDEFLGEEMSMGYWSESGVDSATDLVKRFGADDWKALKTGWRERPIDWLMRCAEILEYSDLKEGVAPVRPSETRSKNSARERSLSAS